MVISHSLQAARRLLRRGPQKSSARSTPYCQLHRDLVSCRPRQRLCPWLRIRCPASIRHTSACLWSAIPIEPSPGNRHATKSKLGSSRVPGAVRTWPTSPCFCGRAAHRRWCCAVPAELGSHNRRWESLIRGDLNRPTNTGGPGERAQIRATISRAWPQRQPTGEDRLTGSGPHHPWIRAFSAGGDEQAVVTRPRPCLAGSFRRDRERDHGPVGAEIGPAVTPLQAPDPGLPSGRLQAGRIKPDEDVDGSVRLDDTRSAARQSGRRSLGSRSMLTPSGPRPTGSCPARARALPRRPSPSLRPGDRLQGGRGERLGRRSIAGDRSRDGGSSRRSHRSRDAPSPSWAPASRPFLRRP